MTPYGAVMTGPSTPQPSSAADAADALPELARRRPAEGYGGWRLLAVGVVMVVGALGGAAVGGVGGAALAAVFVAFGVGGAVVFAAPRGAAEQRSPAGQAAVVPGVETEDDASASAGP